MPTHALILVQSECSTSGLQKKTVRDAGALQQDPVKMRLRAGFAGFFPERWKFVAKNRNAWLVRAA